MTSKIIVLGVVGEIGSGKDTIGKLLEEILPAHDVFAISFSVILRKMLKAQSKPPTRKNLQQLGRRISQTKQCWLIGKMHGEILRRNPDICVLTGLRTLADVRLVKSFPSHRIIALSASPRIRFQRVKARSRLGDGTTWLTFLAQSRSPIEARIPKLMERADVHLVNEGSLEEFREAIATKVLPKIQELL
jgi:dephospho-CoA kinase